ncbi:hypothetical protein BCD67_23310 [Oscillatoriales cyanobacterium USR001]|nr:hypothetical protein BCD67_23310 [Oscillatoriales cyanobacterium USR001]
MFAKFRALYPTGQLISELVTIYQGKFIVRTLVQLDGKTLVTAMSAGDTVELAEDQAWKRSLSLLDLNSPVSFSTTPVTPPSVTPLPQPEVVITPEKVSPTHQNSFVNTQSQINQAAYLSPPETMSRISQPQASPQPPKAASIPLPPKQLGSDSWLSSSYGDSSIGQEISTIPVSTSIKSETGLTKPSNLPEFYSSVSELEVEPLSTMEEIATPLEISPPSELIEDNSETIAQIDVLLKRLKWKKEQESEYLLKAYGKKSQDLLAKYELLDFLDYLEIFSKTTEEITRLGWDSKQGRDYLKQAYGEIARHHLTKEQLVDFLEYLESK